MISAKDFEELADENGLVSMNDPAFCLLTLELPIRKRRALFAVIVFYTIRGGELGGWVTVSANDPDRVQRIHQLIDSHSPMVGCIWFERKGDRIEGSTTNLTPPEGGPELIGIVQNTLSEWARSLLLGWPTCPAMRINQRSCDFLLGASRTYGEYRNTRASQLTPESA
jgi:hypothetical protein